ncbi:hypothetical protein [Myxacorys almedinensis]|uniref:Uncharacterized protein n=1 Tax=Myxacorys almedinensis A TaxID=2690445 RepID=A0A8J7YXV9_9CYAN|nr:hypothetical protein [Myxacorys almedinensis]NDJ16559.1 hypothetical protein [Myxacorys almedinensis A]
MSYRSSGMARSANRGLNNRTCPAWGDDATSIPESALRPLVYQAYCDRNSEIALRLATDVYSLQ